jgi:hypothetical protein
MVWVRGDVGARSARLRTNTRNPEGTLARWEQPNSYARVFGYDEEGRLVKIDRITGLAACKWRMSTGIIATVFGCGSGMGWQGRSIGIYAE